MTYNDIRAINSSCVNFLLLGNNDVKGIILKYSSSNSNKIISYMSVSDCIRIKQYNCWLTEAGLDSDGLPIKQLTLNI